MTIGTGQEQDVPRCNFYFIADPINITTNS